MKNILYKLLSLTFITGFLLILTFELYSTSNGITGLTEKNGSNLGCICHGHYVPDPLVAVWISGPDSIAIGQSANYRIYLAHGPAIKGGFDIATQFGILDTSYLDNGVRWDPVDSELTHTQPKDFSNDTVYWTFKYTAPGSQVIDTIFSVANSVNFDGTADTSDSYNFGAKKLIRVYNPIGIISSTEIANNFVLSQNYPNPFNPSTTINYELKKSAEEVLLQIYDTKGNIVQNISMKQKHTGTHSFSFKADKLSSGVYFYRMRVISKNSTAFSESKKMIYLK